ncbi:MAG: mechanosensitive ion channel family protein, partial [Chitinophagales bacterium]
NFRRNAIATAISQELEATSLKAILNNALQAFGLGFLVLIVILFLYRLVRIFKQYIIKRRHRFIHPFIYRDTKVIDEHKMLELIFAIADFFKWILFACILYIGSFFIFNIFPDTKEISQKLIGWIIQPLWNMYHAVIDFIPNLITIIIIFYTFRLLVRFLKYLAKQIETHKIELNNFPDEWAKPTFSIIRFLLYALMFIIIFPFIPGSDSPAFQGVSVFLGLLISLGSTSTISNIISGIVITYMRPFRIGDRIKINDIVGNVTNKNLLVTRIRSIKNEEITIPNSILLTGHIMNFTFAAENHGLILHTTVTIGYDVPWRKMHSALITAALRTKHIEANPSPFVLQTSLDDFYVSYQINAFTKKTDRHFEIYSELHANIQDVCNEQGIEIMSPHYRNQRDGNMTTIPENYLDPNYKAPPFRVQIQNAEPDDKSSK